MLKALAKERADILNLETAMKTYPGYDKEGKGLCQITHYFAPVEFPYPLPLRATRRLRELLPARKIIKRLVTYSHATAALSDALTVPVGGGRIKPSVYA